VLCFIARKFDFHSMDLELFTYYLCNVSPSLNMSNCQALESVWANPFEIFIDVTGQTPSNEVPPEWVIHLVRNLPRSRMENCAVVYHYNINTSYRRQLRTIFREVQAGGFDIEGRSRCLRGLDDIEQYIELSNCTLSDATGIHPLGHS